jgi:hypothetical protein
MAIRSLWVLLHDRGGWRKRCHIPSFGRAYDACIHEPNSGNGVTKIRMNCDRLQIAFNQFDVLLRRGGNDDLSWLLTVRRIPLGAIGYFRIGVLPNPTIKRLTDERPVTATER